MTQEQKEKAYDEALKYARYLINERCKEGTDGSFHRADLQKMFPELKESEDEKVRKSLIDLVINYGDRYGNKQNMLAWIEKQKVTDEEIIFRPLVGTDIRIASKQALEKIDIGKKVVLAFNGAYIPVNGKTVGEIDSEYNAWLEKQGKYKYTEEDINNAYKCADEVQYKRGYEDALKEVEKQGKQKPIETRTIGYWNVQEMITPEESLGISSEEWNKIEEECIFGNDKPKFKVGDWVVENEPNNYARFVQILDIVNVQGKERYRISRDIHNDEDIVEFNFVEKYYRHFNIQDAKDGDVLINWNNTVFIFKDIADETVKFHIAYNEKWDAIKTPSTKFSHLGLSEPQFEFHPATKEQRELLFSKMKEAGYEWDAEKKELKKIELNEWVPQKGDVCRPKKGGNNIILCEQDGIVFSFVEDVKNGCAGGEISIPILLRDYKLVEPKDNTFDISFSARDSEFQEASYYIPEGFHAEIDGNFVSIKKGEQKTAWSEEDECYMSECIGAIATKDGWSFEEKRKTKHWLKSLKDRVQPQPNQEWSKEEDEGKPIDLSEFDLHLNRLLKQFETLSKEERKRKKEELESILTFYLNIIH